MKTLSLDLQNEQVKKGYEPRYYITISCAGTMIKGFSNVKFQAGKGSETIYWNSIKSLSDLQINVNDIIEVSNFTCEIQNRNKSGSNDEYHSTHIFSELTATRIDIWDIEVAISFNISGNTEKENWEDRAIIFLGNILDYSFNYDTINLLVANQDLYLYKNIANNVINITDFPNASNESLGESKPIIYGSFDNNYSPCLLINTAIGEQSLLYSAHSVNTDLEQELYIYDRSQNNFCKVNGITINDNGIITFDNNYATQKNRFLCEYIVNASDINNNTGRDVGLITFQFPKNLDFDLTAGIFFQCDLDVVSGGDASIQINTGNGYTASDLFNFHHNAICGSYGLLVGDCDTTGNHINSVGSIVDYNGINIQNNTKFNNFTGAKSKLFDIQFRCPFEDYENYRQLTYYSRYIDGKLGVLGIKSDGINVMSSCNMLVFSEMTYVGEVNFIVEIPFGTYTVDALATKIQDAMNEAISFEPHSGFQSQNYTVTYSYYTKKFTISAKNNFSLKWTYFPNSIGRIIGFNTASDDTGTNSYTSDYEVAYIYLVKGIRSDTPASGFGKIIDSSGNIEWIKYDSRNQMFLSVKESNLFGTSSLSSYENCNIFIYTTINKDSFPLYVVAPININSARLLCDTQFEFENYDFYIKTNGRKFQSWIDYSDYPTNTIARTTNYDENDLIENPVYIIESILRDELGVQTDKINIDNFDKIATLRDNWKLCGGVYKSTKVREVIKDILFQSCMRLSVDENHKFKLYILDVSVDSVYTFDSSNIVKDSLSIGINDISEIYSEFYVNYSYNYATNTYTKQLYANKDETNGYLVVGQLDVMREDKGIIKVGDKSYYKVSGGWNSIISTSFTKYGKKNTLEVNANWIQDDATASYLLQYLVKYYSDRHYIVTLKSWYNAVHLEIGDLVNIDNELLAELGKDKTTKWEITKINYLLQEGRIEFILRECIEYA